MTQQTQQAVASGRLIWQDYLEICKPRIVLLMLLCSLVGMFMATAELPPWQILLFGNLGIALVAASAGAINHIADAQIDMRMLRTHNRPIANNRISVKQGLFYAGTLGTLGFIVLYFYTNMLTVLLNFLSWAGYGLFYTLYLKRTTPQNIVIGGLFGAAPPLLGWSAITGSIEPGGLLLTLIIFLWTPPHFWALALDRKEEYRQANIPILPLTHGVHLTKMYILSYTLLLFVVSLWPFAIGMSGLLYLLGAFVLSSIFLVMAIMLLAGANLSIKIFRYSILYLGLLFSILLLDHYLVNPEQGFSGFIQG